MLVEAIFLSQRVLSPAPLLLVSFEQLEMDESSCPRREQVELQPENCERLSSRLSSANGENNRPLSQLLLPSAIAEYTRSLLSVLMGSAIGENNQPLLQLLLRSAIGENNRSLSSVPSKKSEIEVNNFQGYLAVVVVGVVVAR